MIFAIIDTSFLCHVSDGLDIMIRIKPSINTRGHYNVGNNSLCHATTCQSRANIILLNLNFSCVVVVPAAPNCFTSESIILLGRQTDKKSESISTTGRFQWTSCVIRFPDEYNKLNIRSTNTHKQTTENAIFSDF